MSSIGSRKFRRLHIDALESRVLLHCNSAVIVGGLGEDFPQKVNTIITFNGRRNDTVVSIGEHELSIGELKGYALRFDEVLREFEGPLSLTLDNVQTAYAVGSGSLLNSFEQFVISQKEHADCKELQFTNDVTFELQKDEGGGTRVFELRNDGDATMSVGDTFSVPVRYSLTQHLSGMTLTVDILGDVTTFALDEDSQLTDDDGARWMATTPVEVQEVDQLMGDVDGDGVVGFADFTILSDNFGSKSASRNEGDLNRDGYANFADFLIFTENFGARLSPA